MIDCALYGGIQKAFDGRVKGVERNQSTNAQIGDRFGGMLKGIEHGALTHGEMQSGRPGLTNRFKHFL